MALIANDLYPRCRNCNKLLAVSVTRPWVIVCGRCKVENGHDGPREKHVEIIIDNRT